VLVEAGDAEGVTFWDADPEVVPAVREEFPVLADRALRDPSRGGSARGSPPVAGAG
jgi:hypothetical protein